MDSKSIRIALIRSRFNEEITSKLASGAKKALLAAGLDERNIQMLDVDGAYEIPLAAKWCIDSTGVDGVIGVGAVIKGDTDHYEYVCQAATYGFTKVQLETGVPVGFGVLTCQTEEQAFERTGGKHGNKGEDVAKTVLDMIRIKKDIIKK